MSENIPEPTANPNTKIKFRLEEGILIFLLILSLVGMGLTDFYPKDVYLYWLGLMAVFAISATVISWLRCKQKQLGFKRIIAEQSLHWGGVALVAGALFSSLYIGRINAENTGIVLLLVLALAVLLDSLRVGWRFSVIGLFLGCSAAISIHIDKFLWMEFLLAFVIVVCVALW